MTYKSLYNPTDAEVTEHLKAGWQLHSVSVTSYDNTYGTIYHLLLVGADS